MFVPETAPLEGQTFLDLEGLFAAAALGRTVAGIAHATPFDDDQTQLKKPEPVTIACCFAPQREKPSKLVYTVHGALFSTIPS